MNREFALEVSFADNVWEVTIKDGQSFGVTRHSGSLVTAMLDAITFVRGHFEGEQTVGARSSWCP